MKETSSSADSAAHSVHARCASGRLSSKCRRGWQLRAFHGRSGNAAGPALPGVRGTTAARRGFTFIEILLSAAILGISLAFSFSLIGGARARLLRAERRWARQNNLNQATEFFLLGGPEANPPDDLLPEGYTATCSVALAEDVPEHAQDPVQGWVLAAYTIQLWWRGGDLVAEHAVEKLTREDDL